MEEIKTYLIIIDTETRLGKKEFVQGQIHGIVSTIVCITDKVHPNDVFNRPDRGTKSHLTLYVDCTSKAFELIKEHVEEHYPKLCLFGEYAFN